MQNSNILFKTFLGNAPNWYKLLVLAFLIINPIVYFYVSPFVAGWLLVVEFIITLAMALKCYPLQPGGLLAIEAVFIGMTSPKHIKAEIIANFEVVLLLIFMVAGIYFMKSILLYAFTKILVKTRSKITLSLVFCVAAAFLSAFLDALTVIAVIISVTVGFYGVYHKFESELPKAENEAEKQERHKTLEQFRAFLRSLLMHSGVGTALGGAMTLVGEPQNLIIAEKASWSFVEFFLRMAPVTIPVFLSGLFTCFLLEKFKIFGYGATLPESVFKVLSDFDKTESENMTKDQRFKLWVQGLIGVWLIIGLAFHLADVGIIGLSVIILATAFCGVIDEHALGKAFQESLPFTALLVVFFVIVAVIVDLKLFEPVIKMVLSSDSNSQLSLFYIFNALLSVVSDNVFVGTVYINEVKAALENHIIDREQFDLIAVAINVGTNLPSVATPNGQAAFLFLLTSSFAPLINLSYGRMVIMALPYTLVLSLLGFVIVSYVLPDVTHTMLEMGLIDPHMPK